MPLHDVVAIVLGGGRGSRLYPLTKMRAKPAVPLAGKYRLIDIPISNCINSGITKVFVLTQFLSASLHRHLLQTYKFDVFSKGFVDLLAADQTLSGNEWYQGTADAVRHQLRHFLARGATDVLILAGDHLYRMDYADFVRAHRATRADLSVGVLPVNAEDASRFGILKTDEHQRITAFKEKPQGAEALRGLRTSLGGNLPYLGSMGIYLFRLEVLTELLESVPKEDFGRDIIPQAIESHRVYAYPFNGYWEDIGTISTFYEANLALTRPDPPFDFYDRHRPIYTRPRFLPPTQIDGCSIKQTVMGEGCRLYQADVEECVVGLRSVIWPGTRLQRVVMMGADYYEDDRERAENVRLDRPDVGIGSGCEIERAIIDKNARIGQRVIIRNHDGDPDMEDQEGRWVIRDGFVVVPKDAVIPDGTVI